MIYTIENSKIKAKINSLGAELVSAIYNGREYIWQAKPGHWQGHAPVLFPIVGRPKEGAIEVDGVKYPIGSHGFAKISEFSLAEGGSDYVTLRLCDNAETREHYPFAFEFSVTYRLCDNKIVQTYEVLNTDKREIYFNFGAHPGFAISEDIRDWEIIFDPSERLRSLTCTKEVFIDSENRLELPHENGHVSLTRKTFANDALIFDDLKHHKITLSSKKEALGVTVRFEDFPEVGVWTQPNDGADFVCLEPWCGMGYTIGDTGVLKDKKSIVTLLPDTTCKKSLEIELF